MKIKFNGILEHRESGGCKACGKKSKGGAVFLTTRNYILPSGICMDFRMGEEYELSDLDAEFLLSYTGPDANGTNRAVFEEVQ